MNIEKEKKIQNYYIKELKSKSCNPEILYILPLK